MPNQLHQEFHFTRLKKYVWSYAMLKILPEVQKFNEKRKKDKDLDPCTGAFTKIWGLPCEYGIEKKCFNDVAILLTDVD